MDLEPSAVDRVLRRAGQLSEELAGAPAPPGATSHRISEDVLLAAAAEAGLDPDAVRVSLALERLGEAPPARRFDATCGPREVVVDRIVAASPDILLGRLDDVLVKQFAMRRVRGSADRGEWRRRTDAVGTVNRLARSVGQSRHVCRLVRVDGLVTPVDASRTLLRVIADRSPQRTGALAGGATVGGAALVVTTTVAVAVSPLVVVAAPVAAVAGVAAARAGRRQHEELLVDLGEVLDAVERGRRPVPVSDSVRKVLRAIRS